MTSTPSGPPGPDEWPDDPIDRVVEAFESLQVQIYASGASTPDGGNDGDGDDDDGDGDGDGDYYPPTPPGMVGPEHVERGFDLTALEHAREVAERHGLRLTAWLTRRAYRRVSKMPLQVPFPRPGREKTAGGRRTAGGGR